MCRQQVASVVQEVNAAARLESGCGLQLSVCCRHDGRCSNSISLLSGHSFLRDRGNQHDNNAGPCAPRMHSAGRQSIQAAALERGQAALHVVVEVLLLLLQRPLPRLCRLSCARSPSLAHSSARDSTWNPHIDVMPRLESLEQSFLESRTDCVAPSTER